MTATKKQKTAKNSVVPGKPFVKNDPRINKDGRPKDTPEQKLVKRKVRALLKEYEEDLASALPELSPVLVEKAKTGDVGAFKEIHKVVGAHKAAPSAVTAVQVNFGEDREKYV